MVSLREGAFVTVRRGMIREMRCPQSQQNRRLGGEDVSHEEPLVAAGFRVVTRRLAPGPSDGVKRKPDEARPPRP